MSLLAEIIVEAIEDDFTDRRGLRQEWERIDDETLIEIRQTWARKVDELLIESEARDE